MHLHSTTDIQAPRFWTPTWSASLRLLRSPYTLLFLTLMAVYAYTPPRWQDWNQNSRIDLTMAIVDEHTVQIDSYVANTGDYATVGSHSYSDKAPGLSLAAIPVYAAVRIAEPLGLDAILHRASSGAAVTSTLNPNGRGLNDTRLQLELALYLATLICVGLPGAITAVLVALMVERLTGCRTSGIAAGLILGLATPLFTYSQAFYGHVPAAACITAALAILVLHNADETMQRSYFFIGLLLALAVVIEYPAALAGAPVALWALGRGKSRAVIYGVLGSIAPFVVLAIYDLTAFGTPLPVGYEHSTLWQDEHRQGFLSITHPTWNAIWGLSFSPFRGLFFSAPVLLLAIAGVWIGLRNVSWIVPTVVTTVGFVAIFMVIGSSVMWWGGFAAGPRYLLPGVPLLGIPIGFVVARVNSSGMGRRIAGFLVIGTLSAISVAMTWSLTFAGQSYPPDAFHSPLREYVLPAFRHGDIARNLGNVLQLSGIASLLPLAIITGVGILLIAFQLRPRQPGRASFNLAIVETSGTPGFEGNP